jgi:hypothetical protein
MPAPGEHAVARASLMANRSRHGGGFFRTVN